MNLGYVHEIVHEGRVLPVEDATLIACQLNNSTIGSEGNFRQGTQR